MRRPARSALAGLAAAALAAGAPPHDLPDALLFVKRFTFQSSHIYTDYTDGSVKPGGNLCVLSPAAPHGNVRVLAPSLDGGFFGRFDLSFDARRVVFAYKRGPKDRYRLYEIGVDGAGLRQLTRDAPGEAASAHRTDDMDPCYLPDGRIAFVSTRSRREVLCFHTPVATLHVMGPDGRDIRCLSDNTVNDFTPTVLDDGRILYTRWEYVDKGCGDVQSLWSVRPDGTGSAHVYKNNVSRPATLIDARPIPGSHRLVAIGAPHMPVSVGPVILIDPRVSPLDASAMTNLTPQLGYPGHNNYPNGEKAGYYKDPWPLADGRFLVSYNPGPSPHAAAGYGIFLLDAGGRRELVYRDPAISCFQPVPLRPRTPPPVLAPAQAAEEGDDGPPKAVVFLQDVYAGLDGVARGRAKFIRVMEDVPKPWGATLRADRDGDRFGLQGPPVSLRGPFSIKRVHGVAPLEEDGSAFFTVPANLNLYFQVLDGDYLELQRMRTFVNLAPGEQRSCIGCHEPRARAPEVRRPRALDGPPRPLAPQPGESGPRAVHYPADVQPAWDRHCATCHGDADPKGGLSLSGTMTVFFSRSYEELINRKWIDNIDIEPRDARIPAEPPLSVGSHRSRLVRLLRAGHYDAKLDPEEFVRLVTWIDANAPYYGTYEGRRNIKWKGQPGFRPDPVAVK